MNLPGVITGKIRHRRKIWVENQIKASGMVEVCNSGFIPPACNYVLI